jgi:hypothetical protein
MAECVYCGQPVASRFVVTKNGEFAHERCVEEHEEKEALRKRPPVVARGKQAAPQKR